MKNCWDIDFQFEIKEVSEREYGKHRQPKEPLSMFYFYTCRLLRGKTKTIRFLFLFVGLTSHTSSFLSPFPRSLLFDHRSKADTQDHISTSALSNIPHKHKSLGLMTSIQYIQNSFWWENGHAFPTYLILKWNGYDRNS